jgi:hypothetical protein
MVHVEESLQLPRDFEGTLKSIEQTNLHLLTHNQQDLEKMDWTVSGQEALVLLSPSY